MARRKTHRKGKRSTRRMRGGQLPGSELANNSMNMPSRVSGLQGQEFLSNHANQHGGYQNNTVTNPATTGMVPTMNQMNQMKQMSNMNQMGGMAPVGDTGVLDASLRGAARLDVLDQSFNEIQGMNDQSGGRRRRRRRTHRGGRKSRKSHRRHRSRRSHRSHRMRGGSSPVDAPTMLLPTPLQVEAVSNMNSEWPLAENPNSFSPLN